MVHMTHPEAHANRVGQMKATRSKTQRWARRGVASCPMLPPIIYITIKAKRFEREVGNTCKTPGRTCFLQICSSWVWVRKLEWMWFGRGFDSYIQHATLTWAYFKLKDAATQLGGACGMLLGSASPVSCHICNNKDNEHEVLAVAAGQVFEHVTISEVQTRFDTLEHVAKQTGLPQNVTICRSVNRVTWFAPEAETKENPHSKTNLHVPGTQHGITCRLLIWSGLCGQFTG